MFYNGLTLNAKEITEICIPSCQPCDEQGQTNLSTHWCMTCPDFICEGCHAMHMTLRSTRNHVILEINDYKKIGKFLARFDNRCKNHKGEIFNYFCFTHKTPCCCVCKDKNHNKDCDTQHEDDIFAREENSQVLLKNTHMVEKRLSEIDEKIERNENDSTILHSNRELFEAELIAGRQQINEFYDKFEAKAIKKFNKKFRKTQESLNFQREQTCDRQKNLTHIKEIMEKTKTLNTTKLQSFMIGKHIQEELNEKDPSPDQETEIKPLVILPTVNVNSDNQTISLTYGYELPSHPHDKESTLKTTEENSSSTVEDEVNIEPATNNIALEKNNTVSCAIKMTSDSNEKGSIICKVTSISTNTSSTPIDTESFIDKTACITSETESVTKQTAPKTSITPLEFNKTESGTDITTTKTKGTHCADESNFQKEYESTRSTVDYRLKESFNVEHRKENFEIVSVGIIKPDIIIMSEVSEKRLLFYRTNGLKFGGVEFKEEPGDIAIIEEQMELVVGVYKILFFIGINDQRKRNQIYLCKTIEAVAYANGFIYVCLHHRGIFKMNHLGGRLQRFQNSNDSLNICVTSSSLFFVKMESNTTELHSDNLSTRIKKKYTSKSSISGYIGIACDIHGNVYLSDEISKVYMFHKDTKCFSVILSGDSGISHITSISCSNDAKTFVVACNGGREIKVFEKQTSCVA